MIKTFCFFFFVDLWLVVFKIIRSTVFKLNTFFAGGFKYFVSDNIYDVGLLVLINEIFSSNIYLFFSFFKLFSQHFCYLSQSHHRLPLK